MRSPSPKWSRQENQICGGDQPVLPVFKVFRNYWFFPGCISERGAPKHHASAKASGSVSRPLSLMWTTMAILIFVLRALRRKTLPFQGPTTWPRFPSSLCRRTTLGERLISPTPVYERWETTVVLWWCESLLHPEALAFSLILRTRSCCWWPVFITAACQTKSAQRSREIL